jgi:hypothetical protein
VTKEPNIEAAKAHIHNAQSQLDLALQELDGATPPEPEPPYAWAVQDRDPREKPPLPTLGSAGKSFVDPALGATLTRITDATMGGSSWRIASNAHVASWSADAKKFYLLSPTGKQVFKFNPTTGIARPLTTISSQCEPTWSRSVVDGMWAVGGPVTRTIQALFVHDDGTVETRDILNLDHLGLGLAEPRTYVGGMVSADGAVAVFFGGQGQDDHHWAAVLLEGESQFAFLVDTLAEPGLGFKLHSISIDRTGRYVVLYPVQAKPFHMVIWDTQTRTFAPVTFAPWGHDTQGYGWEINHDVASGEWDGAQWAIRKLDELDVAENLIEPVLRPKETYFDDHATWHNARPEALLPVFTATYRYNNEEAPWRAWDDEIIGIATDGPSTVYRFCQHRSDVRDERDPSGASTYFWYQPIPSVSPDGKWLLFHSNWEKTLGLDPNDNAAQSGADRSRQDVFLVKLTT